MPAYPCQCHVCGKRFVTEAEFLSSPLSIVGEDGVNRCGMSCGDHTAEEIRAAWEGSGKPRGGELFA